MKRQKGGGSGWFAMPGGLRGGEGLANQAEAASKKNEEEGGLLLLI